MSSLRTDVAKQRSHPSVYHKVWAAATKKWEEDFTLRNTTRMVTGGRSKEGKVEIKSDLDFLCQIGILTDDYTNRTRQHVYTPVQGTEENIMDIDISAEDKVTLQSNFSAAH